MNIEDTRPKNGQMTQSIHEESRIQGINGQNNLNHETNHNEQKQESCKEPTYTATTFLARVKFIFKSFYLLVALVFGFPALTSLIVGCVYLNASCSMPLSIWCIINTFCIIFQLIVVLLHIKFLKENRMSHFILTIIEILATSFFSIFGIPLLAMENVCVVWETFGFGLHFFMIPLIVFNLFSIFAQATLFAFIFGVQIALHQFKKKSYKLFNQQNESYTFSSDDEGEGSSSDTSSKVRKASSKKLVKQSFSLQGIPFGTPLEIESNDDDVENETMVTYPIDDIISSDEDEGLLASHSSEIQPPLSSVFRRLERNNWKPLRSRIPSKKNENYL